MSHFPAWPIALANVGKTLFEFTQHEDGSPLTVALCLPRIEFASLFVGVGIVSKYLSAPVVSSEEQRMKQFVKETVIFTSSSNETIVGRLVYSEERQDYKICIYDKSNKVSSKPHKSMSRSHVLRREDWPNVRLADRQFSIQRRVGRVQTALLKERLAARDSLAPIFGIPEEDAISGATSLFTIIGNMSRLHEELRLDLQEGMASSLQGILRPQLFPQFESSYRCRISGLRGESSGDDDILIVEASRVLGDIMSAIRNKHRVIILGRNLANYNECANLVVDAFSRRRGEIKTIGCDLPAAMQCLAFYHV